jgi:hypothetical protein
MTREATDGVRQAVWAQTSVRSEFTFFACYSLFAIRDGTPNAVRHTWASLVIP